MKSRSHDLPNRACWLIRLRWAALASVALVIWASSSLFGIVQDPVPLYVVLVFMVLVNTCFAFGERRGVQDSASIQRNIILQIVVDQLGLALLLYFSGVLHNPFVFYFVFHVVNAGLLLERRTALTMTGVATVLVAAMVLLECAGWTPTGRLAVPHLLRAPARSFGVQDRAYVAGFLVAYTSTLWFTVYVVTSIRSFAREVQAEVRQKEKMLGIGQLVAGFAHQIGNPVDGLMNCLRLMKRRAAGDQQLTRYAELMSDAVARIEATAKRVQAFARPRGLQLQETDVNEAVTAVAQVLEAARKQGVEIRLELGQLPSAMSDPYSLQEVIFNLCTNAVAAMSDVGILTLRTFPLRNDELTGTEAIGIEVSDTGVGIPEKLIDKIFEPFFTTKADGEGTGLGLGLCRMLISEMGGRIEVDSSMGEGTTFRIVLGGWPRTPRPRDQA